MVTGVIKSVELVYIKMTVTHGDCHEYVGMDFKYLRRERVVECFMKHHLEEIIEDFLDNTPATIHLFEVNDSCTKLKNKNLEISHSIVAKLLFVGKRSRPDIMVAIAFHSTSVSKSDEDDWKKLERLMCYNKGTLDLKLTLSIDSTSTMKW